MRKIPRIVRRSVHLALGNINLERKRWVVTEKLSLQKAEMLMLALVGTGIHPEEAGRDLSYLFPEYPYIGVTKNGVVSRWNGSRCDWQEWDIMLSYEQIISAIRARNKLKDFYGRLKGG